ncbi:TPA: VirB3 family type IV secretion system protein [Serratia fonticola]
MTTLYKALTRPAMYAGVPIAPLLFVLGGLFLAGVYTNKLVWLLIPVAMFILRMIVKQDDFIFNLWFLKLRTKGNAIANRYFKANSLLANQYDAVNIDGFITAMKLNDRAPLQDIIPYSTHVDTHIVKTKNGDYIATWEVMGALFECQSETELELIDRQLATLIRSYSNMPISFYTHGVRESFYDCFDMQSGNPFADKVNALYYDGIKETKFKANTIYYTVVYRPSNFLDKAERKGLALSEKKKLISDHVLKMNEIISMVTGALDKFTANPLGMYEENGNVFSSQLSFYNYLISGVKQKVRVTRSPIYQVLGAADIFFGADLGQVKHNGKNRFFRSIEIKDYTSETAAGVYDALLYSKADYVVTHSFTGMSKTEALKNIKRAEKQLKATEDDAVTQLEELEQLKNDIVAGIVSMGFYHFSLVIYADSLEELQESVSGVSADLTELGLISVFSSLSLPAAFCAQLPGVFNLRPRLSPVTNQNYVELASLHNFYQGKRDKNCWGEAISILKTPSKQAYYLNLHHSTLFKDEVGEKNLANAKIIGTAGSGKTMLLAFITCMLQKFNNPASFAASAKVKKMTTVFLDKDRGAELLIRALGGEYFVVKSGEPTGWNPFYLKNNKRNLVFIKSLIKILCSRNGEVISSREETLINDAVNAVMDMPTELRQYGISRLLEHMTQAATREERENGIVIRLKQWANGAQFGWVFDNAIDSFNIEHCTNFGIDGTEFLDNIDVCAPISFYVLYRITQLLDGRRLVINMDEFWKWLQGEAFEDFAYNKAKTIRKLNGLIFPATQSPDEILKSPISRAIVEICGTSFYLANPDADYDDYVNGFKVTPEEFNIIKNIDPTSRQFLIKKSGLKKGGDKSFSAVVTLDLSGLGVYTKVLSASADNLDVFEDIFKEGMRPDEWLDAYMKVAI